MQQCMSKYTLRTEEVPRAQTCLGLIGTPDILQQPWSAVTHSPQAPDQRSVLLNAGVQRLQLCLGEPRRLQVALSQLSPRMQRILGRAQLLNRGLHDKRIVLQPPVLGPLLQDTLENFEQRT